MSLYNEKVQTSSLTEIWIKDDENSSFSHKAYELHKENKTVRYYPSPTDTRLAIQFIDFLGFEKLPDLLHENGYIRTSGLSYAIGKKLGEKNVQKLTVHKEPVEPVIEELENGLAMTLSYSEFLALSERFKAISAEAKSERSQASSSSFSSLFPDLYEKKEVSEGVRFKRFIANLDTAMISEISRDQVDSIFDFTARLLREKYSKSDSRKELFEAAKLKIDTVALDDIISKFETLLAGSHSEADWGKFLQKNLFLVESRYVDVVAELNVVLAKSRKVDFGMVDTHGFLDIFEIKKPDTQLLSKKTDRGNFYWSTDATKAVTQAEKYLWHADRKAATLSEDLKRQCGVTVEVNRPRAVLVMGNHSQLTTDEMRTDFRMLKASLKNIELVTYDELLDRLRNQRDKIY